MPKSKDPFEELEVDESLLKPKSDEIFEEAQAPVLSEEDKKFRLPAHLSRSHKREEDDWNYNILTSNKNRLRLKVGTHEMAINKRRKLYSARSYLKYVWKLQHELPVYEGPLDDWTLMIQHYGEDWYVVAINIGIEEFMWEEL